MNKQRYSPEFKDEAVKLVLEQGYTIIKASRNLGIGKSTLDNWLKRQREMEASGLNETDQEKLRRFEQENRELRFLSLVERRDLPARGR